MTTNPNEKFHQIPDSAVWYVRTGLERAIMFLSDKIRDIDNTYDDPNSKLNQKLNSADLSESDKEAFQHIRDEMKGIREYHAQWLHEAKQSYAKLPAEVRPTNINYDED